MDLFGDIFQFGLWLPFDGGQFIARPLQCEDQFGELDLKRQRVAVLRRLYQKHHEKRDDGCARIDHQLPGVAVMENWSCYGPQKDNGDGREKVIGLPENMAVCMASRPNQSVLLDGGVPEKVAIG
jgi:hypothetical protein